MKIWISGAAGFIFSNVVRYWGAQYPNDELLVIDRLSYAGSLDNLGWGIDDPRFLHVDCANWHDLDLSCYCIGRPDLLIIAHASSHNDDSLKSPLIFVNDNVVGVGNLLELARQLGIPKIIYMSTDETIKHRRPIQDTEGNWHFYRVKEEDAIIDPSSPYSATKASGEMLVQAYRKSFGLDIDMIRCTNQYGPRQHTQKFLSQSITKALNNESIPLYGQGLQWRDWLYVDDFCKALDIIAHTKAKNQDYHVAANNEQQNIAVLKKLLRKLNRPYSLIKYVPDRVAHDFSYSLDCSKLKELGWAPKVSFEDGLDRTIAWYREKYIL